MLLFTKICLFWLKIEICIYQTSLPQVGCDIRSVFKLSLDSEFSFSQTGYHLKAQNPTLLNFTHSWGENKWIHAFPMKVWSEMQTGLSKILTQVTDSICPVIWGCRIHRLHLCREVRPTPNECAGYDAKQSDGEVPVMLGFALENAEHPFIAIAPRSTLAWRGSTW